MVSTLCYTDLFNESFLPREEKRGGGEGGWEGVGKVEKGGGEGECPKGVYVQYGWRCNDRTQMSTSDSC